MKISSYMGADPGSLLGYKLRMMLKDIAWRIEKKNKDCFILVVAALGDHKSTLADEMAAFMDSSFTATRAIFRDYHYYKLKRELTKRL